MSVRYSRWAVVVFTVSALAAITIGCGLGVALGQTANIQRRTDFDFRPALPSLLLDRRGKLIAEYFADERREIVSIYDLPKHLLEAVIVKEDRSFFSHPGFSAKGILRAAWNILAGHYFSGGSTISQQVAGNLYDDRSVTTLGRKFSELWWSFQLERKRSKMEILEIYLNNSKFGHGNYGVESASNFYFGHSARLLSLAEATLLTVHLSNPVTRSVINYPETARSLQIDLLTQMGQLGYIDEETSLHEFDAFWARYAPPRSPELRAERLRIDRANEFSELIRRRFEELFYGSPDLYRDGFIIHSGLDLEYHEQAQVLLSETADRVTRARVEDAEYRKRVLADVLLPTVDAVGMLFGIDAVSSLPTAAAEREVLPAKEAIVVGDLVAVENDTGYILAFASSKSGRTDDFQSLAYIADEPKSAGTIVAPLVFSAGIESLAITAATMLYDSPKVARTDGDLYAIGNPNEVYRGAVSSARAISFGLIAPLVTIVEKTGLSIVRDSLSRMLYDSLGPPAIVPNATTIAIDGVYVTPVQVAGAYTVFPRAGRPAPLIAIRYIEDRNGIVIHDGQQRALDAVNRVQSPLSSTAAYIVSDTLASTLATGALARRSAEIGGVGPHRMAAAAGSTTGWRDAWTAGYSRYLTTVVWFGLKPEGSLGPYQSGAGVSGSVWAKFMKAVHADYPIVDESEPPVGVIRRRVCAVSGSLPTDYCTEGIVEVPFIIGTEPGGFCGYHTERSSETESFKRRLLDRFSLSPLPIAVEAYSPDDRSADPDEPPGSTNENPFLD